MALITKKLVTKGFADDFLQIILTTLDVHIQTMMYVGSNSSYVEEAAERIGLDTLTLDQYLEEKEQGILPELDLLVINEAQLSDAFAAMEVTELLPGNVRFLVWTAMSDLPMYDEVWDAAEEKLLQQRKRIFTSEAEETSALSEFELAVINATDILFLQSFFGDNESMKYHSELSNLMNEHVLSNQSGWNSFHVLETTRVED